MEVCKCLGSGDCNSGFCQDCHAEPAGNGLTYGSTLLICFFVKRHLRKGEESWISPLVFSVFCFVFEVRDKRQQFRTNKQTSVEPYHRLVCLVGMACGDGDEQRKQHLVSLGSEAHLRC
jgi:hypothetical protein